MSAVQTKFIAANAVTNEKLATAATGTFKGNNSGSTAAPTDLTATVATSMLNAFVGDSGSGGTKGLVPAPAAGSNAAFTFLSAGGSFIPIEIDAYEATATASATTTSTTQVLMTGMTETPIAGTYWVIFSATISSNTNGAVITISINSGGTQVAHTVRTSTPQFASGLSTVSLQFPTNTTCVTTVNGSQAIAVFWSISSGTATVLQRTFDLLKIQ